MKRFVRGEISPRQGELLEFLKSFVAREGFSPNFTEIGEGIGARSKFSIFELLEKLEAHGVLHRVRRDRRHTVIVLCGPDCPRCKLASQAATLHQSD